MRSFALISQSPARRTARLAASVLALCLSAGAAQAETHRCVDNGVVRYSDKPCLAVETGKAGGFGPVAQAGATKTAGGAGGAPAVALSAKSPDTLGKSARKPPAWVAHLGGDCRSLHERIRTGRTEQVAAPQLKEWRQQYRQQCSDAESLARQQAKLDKVKAKAEKAPKSKSRKAVDDAQPSPQPKLG